MKSSIYIYSLLLLLNIYSPVLFGQAAVADSFINVLKIQKDDSNRVNTLNAFSKHLLNRDETTRSIPYAREALILSRKIAFKKGEQGAYKNIGFFNAAQNGFLEARRNFAEALKLAEELKDKKGIAEMADVIAQCYTVEENYPEALKFYYSSLGYWEESGNKHAIAKSLDGIAFVFFYQQKYSEALKNGLHALELYKEIGDSDNIVRSYSTTATTYFNLGKYREALEYNAAARKIYEESNDNAGMFYIFQGLGDINHDLATLASTAGQKAEADSKLRESEDNYVKSLHSAELSRDTFLITEACANLGKICIELKEFSKARFYLDKSLLLSKDSKEHLKTVYENLSRLDSASGNYKQAYLNYKMFILYRDSLINEKATEKSVHAKMQYEFDKKEAITTAAQEKKDQAARRTRNLQYTAIAGFLLLAVFLFWNSRQKQKAKAKIEKAYSELKSTQAQLIQSEKMASLGELTAGIAHEIQNPLNFVNNFSDVNKELLAEMSDEMGKGNFDDAKTIAKDVINNEEKINHHGKRADAIVKGMLQHSRSSNGVKESININALADEYLRLSYHGLRAKDKGFKATMKTEFDESIGKINVIPQDIGRVLLNLFNNAFYAVQLKQKKATGQGLATLFEPVVTVSTKKIGDKVLICVKDNGDGIPQKVVDKIFQPFFTTKPTGQGTGLGLSLSYDIVKAHGGELNVETNEGEGACFIISIPFNQ